MRKLAWLAVSYTLSTTFIPVTVEQRGPQRSLVRLRRKAKLPSSSKATPGGIWRTRNHRTWVPTESLTWRRPAGLERRVA